MFSRISKTIAIKKLFPVVPFERLSRHENIFVRCASEQKKQKEQCKKEASERPVEKKKRARVTIVGSCGKVGRTLGLLLKQSPWIDTLAMYDISKQNCGISMDLSHIDTRCRIQAFTGAEQISDALKKSNLVLICAGESRKPAMTIDELFKCNAENVKCIAECFARCCPKAFLGIVTQPVNSLMPMVCEVLKAKSVLDPNKVFGISSVNVIRATTFVSEALNMDPANVVVPVVGGHSENTIVPILSQTKPCSKLPGPETCEIIRLVKKSSGWVYEMKDRKEAAVLSPAFAAARFTNNLLRAMEGQPGVFECVYVKTSAAPGIGYCTIPIELGKEGVKLAKLPKMCDYEMRLFQDATCELAAEIRKGEDYILKQKPKPKKKSSCAPKKKKKKC